MSSKEFVGVGGLKAKIKEQCITFQQWASKGDFNQFHHSHYDWWAFPTNEKSSFGYKFTVTKGTSLLSLRSCIDSFVPSDSIPILSEDKEFIASLRTNAKLLLLSWGWLIDEQKPVEPSALGSGQQWQQYPVRLFKCALSLKLFNQMDMVASIVQYVTHLGYGEGKAVNTRSDDGIRLVRTLELPGYNQWKDPGPRYK